MLAASLALRGGTWDRLIAESVLGGEYGLVEVRGRTVIDIGAHIGAFAVLAAQCGAARVLAYEPDAENFRLLCINARDRRAIEAHRAAVWRSDRREATLRWRASSNPENTGGGSVIRCAAIAGVAIDVREEVEVEAVPLDTILAREGTIGLIKIDAEGSEYPILATSRRLDRVEAIVGEYHAVEVLDPSMRIAAFDDWNADALFDLLEDRGFVVSLRPHGAAGVFRAVRR